MKKGIIILLTIAMLFGIVSCSEKSVVDVSYITLEKSIFDAKSASESFQIKATVSPAEATDKSLIYESDNSAILVSDTGLVTFGSVADSTNFSLSGKITVRSAANRSIVNYVTVKLNWNIPESKDIQVYSISDDGTKTLISENSPKDLFLGQEVQDPFVPYITVPANCIMSEDIVSVFNVYSADKDIADVEIDSSKAPARVYKIIPKNAGITTITVATKQPINTEDGYTEGYTTFAVYVNPIRTENGLKDLQDFLEGTATSFNSKAPLASQTEAFIAEDIVDTSVTSINVNGTKKLDLNGKSVSTTATIRLKSLPPQQEGLALKGLLADSVTTRTLNIDGTKSGSLISTSADSLFVVGYSETDIGVLNINGGTYSAKNIDGVKTISIEDATNLTLKNATVKAESPCADTNAYGIYSTGSLKLTENHTIKAFGNNEASGTKAFAVYAALAEIENGTYTAEASTEAVGVKIDSKTGGSTITNTTVTSEVTGSEYEDDQKNLIVPEAFGVFSEEASITISGGKYNVKSTSSNATAFVLGRSAEVEYVTANVSAGNEARIVDAVVSATNLEKNLLDETITVTGGSLNILRSFTAVGFGDSSNFIKGEPHSNTDDHMRYKLKFVNNPSVNVYATNDATVVKTNSLVSVYGGTFVIGEEHCSEDTYLLKNGYTACLFDIFTNQEHETDETKEEYATNEFINVKAEVFAFNNAVAINAVSAVGNVNTEGIYVKGSSFTATTKARPKAPEQEGDLTGESEQPKAKNGLAIVFNINGTNKNSIFETKAYANGDYDSYAVKANGTVIKKLGGLFESNSNNESYFDNSAYGVYLTDTTLCDIPSSMDSTNGILANTKIIAKSSGSTAKGLYISLNDSFFVQTSEVIINSGLKVDVEAYKSAHGVEFVNAKRISFNNDFDVKWYDGDTTVSAVRKIDKGESIGEAYAMLNNARINFKVGKSVDSTYTAKFTAKVTNGAAAGVLNGIFTDAEMAGLVAGTPVTLADTDKGIINVEGKSVLCFEASCDKDYNKNNLYNIYGYFNSHIITDISDYKSSLVGRKIADSDWIEFTIKKDVGDTKPVTYKVVKGTTWAQFVQNTWSNGLFQTEVVGFFGQKETENIVALASKDSDLGRNYYIADSSDRDLVSRDDEITSGGEYYYAAPMRITTTEDGANYNSTVYYVERNSDWGDFAYVKNSPVEVEWGYNNSYIGKVAYGEAKGIDSYHIATTKMSGIYTLIDSYVSSSDKIIFGKDYRLGLDWYFEDETGEGEIAVPGMTLQGTWNTLANSYLNDFEDVSSFRVVPGAEDRYVFFSKSLVDGDVSNDFCVAVRDNSKDILGTAVDKDTMIVPGKHYFASSEFYVAYIDANGRLDYETYNILAGCYWADFAESSHSDAYEIAKETTTDVDLDVFNKNFIEIGKGSGIFVGCYYPFEQEGDDEIALLGGYKYLSLYESLITVSGSDKITPFSTFWSGLKIDIIPSDDSLIRFRLEMIYPDDPESAFETYGEKSHAPLIEKGFKFHNFTWSDIIGESTNDDENPKLELNEITLSEDELGRIIVTISGDENSYYLATDENTIVYATDELVPSQKYSVALPFSIDGVDGTRKSYYVPVSTTWADFVTEHNTEYSLDTVFKLGANEDSTIVLGLTSGKKEYHVGLLAESEDKETSSTCLIYPVRSKEEIEYGKVYKLGLTFTEYLDATAGEPETRSITVLPGTTWTQFANDAIAKTTEDGSIYTVGNGADSKVYKTIGGNKYYVATNFGRTPVSKDDFIITDNKKDVTYYNSLKFYVEDSSGDRTEYYIQKGDNWGNFAESENGFLINHNSIVYGKVVVTDDELFNIYRVVDGTEFVATQDKIIREKLYKVSLPYQVASLTTSWGTSNHDSWYISSDTTGITINSGVTCNGAVYLYLADDSNLTVTSSGNEAAINVQDPNSFEIFAGEEGTGKLTATAKTKGAGIGGNECNGGGNITINGGVITATGGSTSTMAGAGIGGGGGLPNGVGYNITIKGGKVTATGGTSNNGAASGIGKGAGNNYGTSSNIYISSSLNVKHGDNSAAVSISGDFTNLKRYVTVGNVDQPV